MPLPDTPPRYSSAVLMRAAASPSLRIIPSHHGPHNDEERHSGGGSP